MGERLLDLNSPTDPNSSISMPSVTSIGKYEWVEETTTLSWVPSGSLSSSKMILHVTFDYFLASESERLRAAVVLFHSFDGFILPSPILLCV